MQDNDNENNLYSERNLFTQVEQVVRKLNARADCIFLLDVAFFHLGEHKEPVALLPKMEIANPPIDMVVYIGSLTVFDNLEYND